MLYILGDTHFNHPLMAHLRGFPTTEEHDRYIISLWRDTIVSRDEVWHLGDFSFGGHELVKKYRVQLPGKIHLILGNHDIANRIQNCPELFTSIEDTHVLKYNGTKIFLSHYAHRAWPSSHYNTGHLYAHSHGKLPGQGKSFDIGLDATNFEIWSIDNILEKLALCPDNFNLVKK